MSNLKGFLSKAKAMSKSTLSVVLVLCLLALMLPAGLGTLFVAATEAPAVDTWDGTLADKPFANYDPDTTKFNNTDKPYIIETAEQFAFLMHLINNATRSSHSNGKHTYTLGDKTYTLKGSAVGSLGGSKIELHADLDLDGIAWTPNTKNICGKFDGMGHTISGLSVDATARYAGLFGRFGYGMISNLTVKGDVTSTSTTVGGIVGDIIAGGLENCAFEGNVTGKYQVGGLVGNMSLDNGNRSITNSYASGGTVKGLSTDTAHNQVGGLVGTASTSTPATITVEDCYSAMNVERANASLTPGGGLFGKLSTTTTTLAVKNAFFAGTVGGTNGSPIVVSATDSSTFNNVFYKTGSITGTPSGLLTGVTGYSGSEFTDGTVVALLNGTRTLWDQGPSHPVYAKLPEITNLEVSNGQLTFDKDVTQYNLFFKNGTISSITVTPTVADDTSVKVGDTPVTSGAGVEVPLTEDTTTVINVTIWRGTFEKVYTVNVTCADIWDGITATAYPNADEADAGTAANPYEIFTPEHLAYLAQQVNAGTNYAGKYFKLMNDINLGNQNWTRIGDTSNHAFKGTFDGDGHTISNLYVTGSTGYNGLFGYAAATIKNLTLDGNVNVTKAVAAAFVAYASGNLTFENCAFSGDISVEASADSASTGVFVGGNWNGGTITIEKCAAVDTTITVTKGTLSYAPQSTGGFVGTAASGTDVVITDSYFSGTINGGNGTGGFVGTVFYGNSSSNPSTVTIKRSYTEGTVAGQGTTGGLVGYTRLNGNTSKPIVVDIQDSYSTATVSSSSASHNVCGLVGANYATTDDMSTVTIKIRNAFFTGSAKYPIYHKTSTVDLNAQSVLNNIYYKAGSATATSDLTPAATCEKAESAFTDGTVRDLLNGATGDAWGQGTAHPILLPVLQLDDITLSKGVIAFDPFTYEYQTYVSNVFDTTTVTPTSEDTLLNITVNDVPVQNGQASAEIALADNATTVIKVKIARDGAEKTYTIRVTCVEGWDGMTAIPFPNINDESAGTKENPFLISIPEHLAFLQKLAKDGTYTKGNTSTGVLSTTTVVVGGETYIISYPVTALGNLYGVHFKITADLNLNNKSWNFAEFKGHLDGGNHTIKGLTSTSGLITKLIYGSVSNLNVIGTVSGGSNVGGLVGSMEGGADLTNCSFTGTVSGTTNVGGLVGRTSPYDGSGAIFDIKACWTSGTVSGTGAGIGGLVGNSMVSAQYGGVLNLTDCYSAMTVSTSAASVDNMAGLVGTGNVLYRNCLFVGNVASAYPIGFQASSTVGSVYYKDVSCNTTTSANAGFVGGTKKSAADLNSNALVAVLNTYAAPGVVWAKGAEYPVFTYTDPGDVAAPADPFYMTGLAVEHAAFDFTPSKFTYSLSLPYSADKIHMLPSAPANLTITIDGQTVKTDELSQAISLEVGVEKTVIIKVSLGDSYTNYEVKLTRRAQPADGVWDGALEPFDSKDKTGSTIDNPIIIDTPGKLAYLAAMTNGQDVMLNGKVYKAPMTSAGQLYRNVYFEITADLKMNDVTDYEKWGTKESENAPTIVPANDFTPIGFHSDTATESRSFAGIVNGNEHKIIGLYVSGKNSTGVGGTGLFGCVEGGTLRNIHIEKGYVTGGQRVGGLVGRPRSSITAQNCSFSGTVYGTFVHKDHDTMAGGLIGDAVARVILNSCWTEGTVTGGNALGGLIGQLYMQTGAEIKNCYSVATIVPLQHDDTLCDKHVGGLIGVLSGKAGTAEIYRSHFAGSVPTNTPFIGGKSDTSGAVITASDTVYYCEGSYVGEVDSTYTYDAVEKSAEEFADGTVTDLLNNLVEYGDYWSWETGDNGYPVSDGVLLVTDYRDHTSDEFYDDGDWYEVFENKPGGTLKDPNGNKGDSDDYDNSDTGETSLFSAALILAMISAISAFLLARRKRSVN